MSDATTIGVPGHGPSPAAFAARAENVVVHNGLTAFGFVESNRSRGRGWHRLGRPEKKACQGGFGGGELHPRKRPRALPRWRLSSSRKPSPTGTSSGLEKHPFLLSQGGSKELIESTWTIPPVSSAPAPSPVLGNEWRGADSVYLCHLSPKPFPTVLLEARCANVPRLATDCGGAIRDRPGRRRLVPTPWRGLLSTTRGPASVSELRATGSWTPKPFSMEGMAKGYLGGWPELGGVHTLDEERVSTARRREVTETLQSHGQRS